MLNDIYKVDGKYPDPYEIENRLDVLKKSPNSEISYNAALKEIKEAGLDQHPLLRRFSVES